MAFAIAWVVFWAFVFSIGNDPSTGQILGFIFIGLGGPLGKFFSDMSR